MAPIDRSCGSPSASGRFGGDAGLAAAAGRREPAAQRELVERVLDQTRRVVGYVVGGRGDADDVVQIALIQILGAAAAFRGDCTLEFWATRIAVRTAIRELRRRRRRETASELVDGNPGTAAPADEEAQARGVRARLAAALGKLTPERRVAVVLHHVEGYGIPEIATMTEAPINTVRDRLRTGRRQLRRRILADPALRGWLETGQRG